MLQKTTTISVYDYLNWEYCKRNDTWGNSYWNVAVKMHQGQAGHAILRDSTAIQLLFFFFGAQGISPSRSQVYRAFFQSFTCFTQTWYHCNSDHPALKAVIPWLPLHSRSNPQRDKNISSLHGWYFSRTFSRSTLLIVVIFGGKSFFGLSIF